MKIIEINSRKHGYFEVLVDDEDYEYLNQFKWRILICGTKTKSIYVQSEIVKSNKKKTVTMHKFLLGDKLGYFIDHIDHNGLNNQKYNLRFSTRSQNGANRRPSGFSKYLGVHFDKYRNTWRASITFNKKTYKLGRFETEIEAAIAYDKKAREFHGQFANLNFSDEIGTMLI